MEQKVLVYTSLVKSDTQLIICGIRLANLFKKELCLFYQASKAFHDTTIDCQLKNYRDLIRQDVPDLPVSILISSLKGENLASKLADDNEVIIMVADSSDFSKLAVSLRNSPIPFLFIDGKIPFLSDFRKVIFPVDLRHQNQDAMKWVLYFGKYNHSEITAIGANDKVKANQRLVTAHLWSLKKMLTKSGVSLKIIKGTRSSLGIHNEGLSAAFQLQADLLILLGSSTITILDLLVGLPEEKMIKKAAGLPVLVVNPRRETYLVCE
jgi:hypothetical protein